ncbi:MAG TPA: DUF4159 domain-containing protein, partial [Humisphaera sp.]
MTTRSRAALPLSLCILLSAGAATVVADGQTTAPATRPAAPVAPPTKQATKPAAPVSRPAKPVPPPPAPPTVDSAVATLVAEANACFVEEATRQITIVRPHPAVAKMVPQQAGAVLRAMAGKLTGDALKDAYVRYHLMDVVNRALDASPESLVGLLMPLCNDVPGDTKVELKPWHTYDPPDVGMRWHKLYHSTAVTVGFPPFQRTLWAPESLPYMDPQARAKAEAAWAEAQTLKGKFREVEAPKNHTYNWRQIWMNWVVRQYRGELVYAMVAQGDAKAFDMIVDGVVHAAATDPVRASDFASFLNAAFFNGFLGKYDKPALKRAAMKLRAAAVASEAAARDAYNRSRPVKGANVPGPTVSVGWVNGGGRWRQVPESLFTVVYAIENDRVPAPVPPAQRVRPVAPPETPPLPPPATKPSAIEGGVPIITRPATRPATGPFAATTAAATKPAAKPVTQPATAPATKPVITPDAIDIRQIDEAIARGVAGLETLRPPDVDLNYLSYQALRLPANYWYSDYTLPGQGALTTWALQSCGESELTPWMQKRINWVLCFDSPTTYDRAMRLRLLSKMRRPDLQPWIKRDALWVVDTMTEQGNWEARNVGTRSAGFGDNANGQYAILGLWAAAEAGVQVPDAVWAKADRYWRQGQRPPGAPGDGAWAVTSTAALKKGVNLNAFTNQVSASMTAGGVLSLYLTEMYLVGDQRADVGQSLSPELLRGVNWLDQNFSLDKLDGDSDFYFYAWTIQNVGQATGYRTFNDVDWFRHITARLLNTQQPNGLWTGPKGPHVSTSFALLFLSRARGPLAVCKVRWEPNNDPPRPVAAKPAAAPAAPATPRALAKANAWNNRPNDLYNFATEISRRNEVPTSWQIVDLDQPVHELAESAMLYLATDKPFRMRPEQVERLKQYVDAGGLLVCVPEGRSNAAALNSMKALAAQVSPGVTPVRRAEASHPFFALGAKLKVPVPLWSYETAVRPRVVVLEQDVGRSLQLNDPKDREAFSLLNNLYLYATGLDPRRPRIVANYLPERKRPTDRAAAVARVQYAGDFDPEPLAMAQLQAHLAERHGVGVRADVVPAEQLAASNASVAFLTVSAGATLSEAQLAGVKTWVDAGGTLFVDATAGSEQAAAAMEQVLARAGWEHGLVPLAGTAMATGDDVPGAAPLPTPLFRQYRAVVTPKVQVLPRPGGRPAVVVVRGDLSAGLAGMNHHGIVGLTP